MPRPRKHPFSERRTWLAIRLGSCAIALTSLVYGTAFAVVNDTRSFRMGFTTFPYDTTLESFMDLQDKLSDHGDLVAFHLNSGLPWQESLDQSPYHPNVEQEIADMQAMIGDGQEVYLALSALNEAKSGLAKYWASEKGLPLPSPWNGYGFDAPQVIDAYSNFAVDMIGRLNVTYLNVGIEAMPYLTQANSAMWASYVAFVEGVTTRIKAVHPDVMISVSMVLYPPGLMTMQQAGYDDLAPFIDYLCISAYPYAWPGSDDPATYPANWLTQLPEIADGKPVAVCETSFLGESLNDPATGWNIPGSEQTQEAYVSELLDTMHTMNALFVVWWSVVDFDRQYATWDPPMQASGVLWRDTGLYDGDVNPREALQTWDGWLNRDYVPGSGGGLDRPSEDCPVLDGWLTELQTLADLIGAGHVTHLIDLDGSGVPDSYEFALLAWGVCGDYSEQPDAMEAYSRNVTWARGTWLPTLGIGELFGAYFTLSQPLIDVFVPMLGITGTYETYQDANGEPFVGAADLDGDGMTNAQEYDAIIANGGGHAEFVEAATTPSN